MIFTQFHADKCTIFSPRKLKKYAFIRVVSALLLLSNTAHAEAILDISAPSPASEESLAHVPTLQKLLPPPEENTGINIQRRGHDATIEAAEAGRVLDFSQFRKWKGLHSTYARSATQVARNSGEWEALWHVIDTTSIIDEVPEKLPLGTIAIAIFLGNRPSEFFSIRLLSVNYVEKDDSLRVTYIENKPRNGIDYSKILTNGTTNPWIVYLVPEVKGMVRFFKKDEQ